MKIYFYFILLIALGLFGCTSKHKVNFIVHNCTVVDETISFTNVRLFKAKATVQYGDGTFITFLSEGQNNLELVEGYYYVECYRQVQNPNWKEGRDMYKFFDVTGTISEYDLCKIYNRGDWSPK